MAGAKRRLRPDETMASEMSAARRACQRGEASSGLNCALSTGQSVRPTPSAKRCSALAPARTASA